MYIKVNISGMYITVYISGMEMTQRIHNFWYQILLDADFLRKWQKITFLVKISCDKLKRSFWVKNVKIAWKSC